jgi:hypothetical protein
MKHAYLAYKGIRGKDGGETILVAVSIPQPHDQGGFVGVLFDGMIWPGWLYLICQPGRRAEVDGLLMRARHNNVEHETILVKTLTMI